MTCERARELMIDALVEPLAPEQLDELREHIAECGGCAKEAVEYEELWRQLETVALPKPAPSGLERLQSAIREEFGDDEHSTGRGLRGLFASPNGLTQRIAAAFVLIALGATLTIGLQIYFGDEGTAGAPVDDRARYLLIMTETREAPELTAQVESEFQDWISGLIEQGIMESGIGLSDGPPVGIPPNGTLLNGPVVGFIVIRATDSRDARQIAVSSPIIDYGGFIEIRAIDSGNSEQ